MAINFDALPTDKPNVLPEKGTYIATIEKAEMRNPRDTSKPAYLSLTYALKDTSGKSAGKLFDGIYESDHDLMRYKLMRFITALEIPLTGNFELKDLCKVIQNKTFIVDVTKEEKEGQQPKAVVDIFTNQIYYPMSEASEIFGDSTSATPTINASDAADATAPDDVEY